MAVSQTTTGGAGGAVQGAATGAVVGGPIGAVVGAVLGGAFGALAGGAADNAERAAERQRRLEYNERLRSLRKEEGLLVGQQRSRFAASNVRLGTGSVRTVIAETRSEYARRQMFLGGAYAAERQGAKAAIQAGQAAGFASSAFSAASTLVSAGYFDRPAQTTTTTKPNKGKKQAGAYGASGQGIIT